MPVSLLYSSGINPSFYGRSDLFLKTYRREMKGIPLKDTIIRSISDESNLLREGLSKKGYIFSGIKDYIIRVYKNRFKQEDLENGFTEPKNNYLNKLEGVVLSIPGKIDIVKKKSGVSVGVDKYAERIQVTDFPPMRDVRVTREETLQSLKLYEQLKNFPVSAYKQAYMQMKKFCKKPGFQFDIISPNNILVDTESKQINLIDPVTPSVNKPVHGEGTDFMRYHGCDSLYFVLCDFLMQTEHLNNLTEEEKLRWQKSISSIITKCISAGKSAGFQRNIDRLKILYERIDKFWTTKEVCHRYDNFVDMYSAPINQPQIVANALNYKNSIQERINAIKHLDGAEFKELKPVFQKILEAPHQPKVEIPEVLNATLDKLLEYGKSAKSITPSLEKLFEKEIFYTTKKRLYQLFIQLQPYNKKFLEEISKSACNPLEKCLYREEFETLYKKVRKFVVKSIYKDSAVRESLPDYIANKLWMSRTCTTSNKVQQVSINNMIKGYSYIESKKNGVPNAADLIEIHKIVLADTPGQEQIVGRLRTPDTDELVKEIFNIKKDVKKLVNDYSASKDVECDLEKLDEYIKSNYDKMNPFELAANVFFEAIRIHPFVNGNGRAIRLFTEQILLSEGYRLMKWSEEALYRNLYSPQELAECLRKNC